MYFAFLKHTLKTLCTWCGLFGQNEVRYSLRCKKSSCIHCCECTEISGSYRQDFTPKNSPEEKTERIVQSMDPSLLEQKIDSYLNE